MNSKEILPNTLRAEAKKMDRAQKERKTILAQTVYLGTIGIIFILPVIAGAYFGVWLDNKLAGYSISWTVSLIFLGVFVGALNVYFFIKE